MKRVVAVASGKGGVGKTWYAITLGHALARMNRKVLLVDCDVGLANVDVQLALAKGSDLVDVIMGETSLSSAIRSIDSLGFDILPARSGGGYRGGLDTIMTGWMRRALRELTKHYEVVILDLPSGIDQGVRDMLHFADESIIVTTSEPTALTDAYALIKVQRQNFIAKVPSVVVNLAEHHEGGRQTLDGLIRVCDRFLAIRPHGLGAVRKDHRVPEAIGRQVPLIECYPGSNASRDVMTTAQTLVTLADKR